MVEHLIGSFVLVNVLLAGAFLALKEGRSWARYPVALVFVGLAIVSIVKIVVTHQPLY